MKLTVKENIKQLEDNFNKSCENPTFVKLVKKLKLSKNEAIKLTSKLEDCVKELENCHNCKGLVNCKNAYNGHVKMPQKENNQVYFTYLPCKYLKVRYEEELEKKQKLEETNLARMKDIDFSDKKRAKVIKWLDELFEKFNFKESQKGLYLYGNFGCGKTFLISALLNELAYQKQVRCEIVYFPELLRTLKDDWNLYEEKIKLYENVDILCIDDIGAEKVSDWGRDEVLGTILQTRMNKNRTTFFTSNLSLEELESHFKASGIVDDKLKSRRIMERIKQLSVPMELISENKRK